MTRKQMLLIYKFIANASLEEKALMVNEILMFTNIMSWDVNTKHLSKIESIALNGDSIQMNVEKEKV